MTKQNNSEKLNQDHEERLNEISPLFQMNLLEFFIKNNITPSEALSMICGRLVVYSIGAGLTIDTFEMLLKEMREHFKKEYVPGQTASDRIKNTMKQALEAFNSMIDEMDKNEKQ